MVASRHTLDDARIVHKEAKTLAKGGHEVILLFSCTTDFEFNRLDGQAIAHGNPPEGESDYCGIKVFGVPKPRGFFRKWGYFRRFCQMAVKIEADVYQAHEPDLALAVALYSRRVLRRQGKKAMVVHDMHEFPPGEPFDRARGGLRFLTLFLYMVWDWYALRLVDHVFSANAIVRGYALVLRPRISVDVLYNGPSLQLFPQSSPRAWAGFPEKLILCHEGSLSFSRGLKEMVEAVDQFRDKIFLKIVGDVFGEEKEWLESEILRRGLEGNISRTGWLSYRKVNDEVAACHAGLIVFREEMGNRMSGPPNKLFNYMNAGLPVVSVNFPEIKTIVSEEKCGVLFGGQSVKSICLALTELLSDKARLKTMGENGQRAVRDRYSWEQMEARLMEAYKEMDAHVRH